MKIINNTNLSYKEIGQIIDEVINLPKDLEEIEKCNFLYKGKPINITIRYLKRYVEWRFDYE